MGTPGHVFEGLPARDGPSAAFENPKNWASSSCGLRPIGTGTILEQREGVRQEPQGFTIPTPRFARNLTTWNLLCRARGTCPQHFFDGNPRNPISELHFGKFPDSVDSFSVGRSISRPKNALTQYVQRSQSYGSKKCREQNRWTTLGHGSQSEGEILPILKYLVRR